MLADHIHGQAALADRALLADVVKHKKVFYNASYANYDACLAEAATRSIGHRAGRTAR